MHNINQNKRRFTGIPIVLTMLFLFASCSIVPTPEPTSTIAPPLMLLGEDNPYHPKPEDANLTMTGVVIDSASLLERFDLDPFRVQLTISGSLPSVCNELRLEVQPPNGSREVRISAYSVTNAGLQCDNVFQQFEAVVLLGVYSSGQYTVWINGGFVGDFTMY